MAMSQILIWGLFLLALLSQRQCHRFLIWGLIFGRPGLRQIYLPPWVLILQIPTLRVHIWTDQVLGRSYPLKWQFYRFILWGLIFGRPGLGRSTPFKWQFYREFIFGRPGLGRSTPSLSVSNDNFTDSYSESSCLVGQILMDLPTSPTGISQIPTLRAHIWQTRCC